MGADVPSLDRACFTSIHGVFTDNDDNSRLAA